MTPISFPDDDIYETESWNQFNQIWTMNSVSKFKFIQCQQLRWWLLSQFLRLMSISLQITCFSIHTNKHQLFVLLQIPPTVDHTHPFNGPLSGTTWVGQYQKGKTNLDFTEARDSEWQWHQLDIRKSASRSRQITMPAPQCSVFTGRMPFLPPNQ